MRLRGGRDALCDLPDGVLFRTKARNERRGNIWNQSLKEFFLIIKGDPTTSVRWLARQIDDLADRVPGRDVRRQRVGARFDANKEPVLVPLEDEEEQEQEEEEEDKEQAEQQQEADAGSTYAQETNYSNKHDRPASGTSNDNHSPQQTATQEQTQTAEARTDPPENAADTFQVFATDRPGKESSNQQQTQAPQDSTAEPDNAKADDPSTPPFARRSLLQHHHFLV